MQTYTERYTAAKGKYEAARAECSAALSKAQATFEAAQAKATADFERAEQKANAKLEKPRRELETIVAAAGDAVLSGEIPLELGREIRNYEF